MPHLQELVERHEEDPFVLIGVNTADSPEAYRRGLETFGVTWLSAYQGKTSPIADLYKVEGYPTYVLIDAKGVIRGRGNDGHEMDAPIAKLLKEMAPAAK